MKKLLIVFIAIIFAFSFNAKAEDFYSVYNGDTIYYKITSLIYPYKVSVTCKGISSYSYADEYSGSVSIPDSVFYDGKFFLVSSIDENAFESCYNLISVKIPSSVVIIGARAFFDCTELSTIDIPSSVTTIGMAAFYYTPWYDDIPDGEVYINNFLYEYKTSSTEYLYINVREGTVSVSEYAFYWATGLITISFPNSLTSIGRFAFQNCSLLSSITCSATRPPSLGQDVFKNVNKSIPLYVPASSIAFYQATDGWKDFNIQTIGLDDIEDDNNFNIVISPNPAKDKTKIEFKGLNSKAEIIIYNVLGKEVKREVVSKGTKELEIDVSNLNRGVYNIRIVNETIDKTKKLVVE